MLTCSLCDLAAVHQIPAPIRRRWPDGACSRRDLGAGQNCARTLQTSERRDRPAEGEAPGPAPGSRQVKRETPRRRGTPPTLARPRCCCRVPRVRQTPRRNSGGATTPAGTGSRCFWKISRPPRRAAGSCCRRGRCSRCRCPSRRRSRGSRARCRPCRAGRLRRHLSWGSMCRPEGRVPCPGAPLIKPTSSIMPGNGKYVCTICTSDGTCYCILLVSIWSC
jgi:hypothetical protein